MQSGNTLAPLDLDRMRDTLGANLTEWLKLRTDQIEQRVDMKMDGLQNELRAELKSKPGHASLVVHTIAIIGIIVAVLAFGGDRFSGGQSSIGAFSGDLVARERRDAATDLKMEEIRRDLREIRQDRAPQRTVTK